MALDEIHNNYKKLHITRNYLLNSAKTEQNFENELHSNQLNSGPLSKTTNTETQFGELKQAGTGPSQRPAQVSKNQVFKVLINFSVPKNTPRDTLETRKSLFRHLEKQKSFLKTKIVNKNAQSSILQNQSIYISILMHN